MEQTPPKSCSAVLKRLDLVRFVFVDHDCLFGVVSLEKN